MNTKRIVIITDCSDIAYSEIRATILNELNNLNYSETVEI